MFDSDMNRVHLRVIKMSVGARERGNDRGSEIKKEKQAEIET